LHVLCHPGCNRKGSVEYHLPFTSLRLLKLWTSLLYYLNESMKWEEIDQHVPLTIRSTGTVSMS
jgi:hypothetical protein